MNPSGTKRGSGDHPAVVDQVPVEILPEDFVRLPEGVPPPRHWLDAHGDTPDSLACKNRKGRYSKDCIKRYSEWIRRPGGHSAQDPIERNTNAPPALEDVAVPVAPQPTRSIVFRTCQKA
eukprot:s490_g30.t1